MSYNPKDYYFKKAKERNFAARSVFKLEEIDQKFKLLKKGQTVLDLGASPGSWSQYCSQKIGPQGKILGVDLSPVTVSLKNAVFIQSDIRTLRWDLVLPSHGFNESFDLILSDMAPQTTGIKITDQAHSVELVELAIQTARQILRPGGHLVTKLFHNDDFARLRNDFKKQFERFEALKPDSTRKMSKEIFLIGLRKK